jgi:hypothetical protein
LILNYILAVLYTEIKDFFKKRQTTKEEATKSGMERKQILEKNLKEL